MNHDQIRDRLSEFRDGAVTREEQGEILRHLAGCPPCVAELNDLEKLSRAFFQPPLPPTAEDTEVFVESVMARLPAPASVPYELLSPRVWAPALGFALAALAFTLWQPAVESADPFGTAVASSQWTAGNLLVVAEDR